jgi:glycosyltransferase involved in cell wall biosynthesis
MLKVLFLSQWYPHRYDKMFGLFVRKHAEAVSLYCEVKVLYIYADKNANRFELVENIQNENFSEIIVYYPVSNSSFGKIINFFTAYCKGFKQLKREKFKPDIIHANVLNRTAIVSYLTMIFKGTPYVITEHWSRYLPAKREFKGAIRKLITRIVVKNAKAILPVSEILKNAMLSYNLKNNNYIILNNVVDDYFFKDVAIACRTKKRMIHISCFDEQAKNIKGILRTISKLSKIRQDFELILIGTGLDFDSVYDYSLSLGLSKNTVLFLGEKTPAEVAAWLQNSDIFILFSNYETAGVVIAESLACGKPVISTKVGAAPEYINSKNGKLVEVADEDALKEEMNFMLDHLDKFDSIAIRNDAKRFSYSQIGLVLSEVYKKSIK